MEGQFLGKRVPWPQLEEYLSVHKKTIVSYLTLLESEAMDKSAIETNLPKSFWMINQVVSKIIKDNNISPK
jgi:chromosome segregation ATPase